MGINSLAERVACHDAAAFELLYQRMYKTVYLICLSIVKDDSSAQDLAQDTFVAVWDKSSEFRGESYKAWILTIAKNKSINYIKKSSRLVSVGQEYELDAVYSHTQCSLEDSLVLKSALEQLSSLDCQIVLLRLSGMKMKEIASLLNMPRGTVSWRYSEALKQLKNILKGAGQ